MTSTFLNIYQKVDALGGTITYVILALMVLVWIWVMFKYLDTSDLNE